LKIRATAVSLLFAGSCLFSAWLIKATPVHGASASAKTWNQQTAARYLDDREIWWQQWPPAQKDHGTVCISCHTTLPYAMARPGLRRELGETQLTAPEKTLRDSVDKRVLQWTEMVPFYSDARNGPGKTAESHATETVLNAVILASYDAQLGHLRPITRTAFDQAWSLQLATGDSAGGWQWQDFHYAPWESSESAYQGAALLLLSAVNAPDSFANEPANRRHLDRLDAYLRHQFAAQPLLNQLYILWASAKEPALLNAPERQVLLSELRSQQQTDGGWRMSSLDKWPRGDHTAQPTESDGYATALAVLGLQTSAPHDPALKRGLTWLTTHQQKDGSWTAASLNKQRDPESDAYLFMTDAATAYAALALEQAH
jgi:squalene-hopene/tetraprenyl-beta-curcumene cyclase